MQRECNKRKGETATLGSGKFHSPANGLIAPTAVVFVATTLEEPRDAERHLHSLLVVQTRIDIAQVGQVEIFIRKTSGSARAFGDLLAR